MWRLFSLEHDFTNFAFLWTKFGRVHIFLKLLSCYLSSLLTIYTCCFQFNDWNYCESFCDAYLILCLYIRLNTTCYINGLPISDRRLLFRHWLSTTVLWDIITLFPFDVSILGDYFLLSKVIDTILLKKEIVALCGSP